MRSKGDLERRALAAAAEARAQEQARLSQARAEDARRDAEMVEMVWRLKTEAAERLTETLGEPSNPSDWKYGTHYVEPIGWEDNGYPENYVETRVLEVDVRVFTMWRQSGSGGEIGLDWKLTLASFGEMLERKRQQEQR